MIGLKAVAVILARRYIELQPRFAAAGRSCLTACRAENSENAVVEGIEAGSRPGVFVRAIA
jgi:hypothetical protein